MILLYVGSATSNTGQFSVCQHWRPGGVRAGKLNAGDTEQRHSPVKQGGVVLRQTGSTVALARGTLTHLKPSHD